MSKNAKKPLAVTGDSANLLIAVEAEVQEDPEAEEAVHLFAIQNREFAQFVLIALGLANPWAGKTVQLVRSAALVNYLIQWHLFQL